MAVPKEKLVDMYEKMVLIRHFENKAHELFAAGKIPGFIHLYAGEEAVAVGACANIRKEDFITSTHRGHGHCIAKGAEPKYMMAELFSKRTGYCKGKGGSMHIADFDIGMLGADGIVGAGIPIAAGAGLSAKIRGTDQVVSCFFGDGATNTGAFHEAVNLASILKLPVVFICENNLYAVGTPVTFSVPIPDIADRAVAYGIPSSVVDGNDVMAVYEAVKDAVKRAREGKGPTLLECKTYRYYGHFEGESITYRTTQEEEEWKKKDPILGFKAKLIDMGVLTEKKAKEIEQKVAKIIEDAVRFAEESPLPAPEETLEDVYAP